MKINYMILSVLNFSLFIMCIALFLLPNFIDRDAHRILLGKLSFNVFFPCLLICLVLSFLNLMNKTRIKNIHIILNYIVLFFLALFFGRIMFSFFFMEI